VEQSAERIFLFAVLVLGLWLDRRHESPDSEEGSGGREPLSKMLLIAITTYNFVAIHKILGTAVWEEFITLTAVLICGTVVYLCRRKR
jgi:hypothetical protein